MELNRVLSSLVSRIGDQRFLFALGCMIIVAGLVPFNLIASMAILASAVFIVVFVVIMDRIRSSRLDRSAVRMVIALDFQGIQGDEDIRLAGAECRISRVLTSQGKTTHTLTPYRGGGAEGWLCPLPTSSGANDVLEFTFTNSHGSRWTSDPIVPSLLWPKVTVRRQS